MRRLLGHSLFVVAGLLGAALPVLPAAPAAAASAPATVTLDDPTRPCAGVGATLTWSRPEGVPDLTGFYVDWFLTTNTTPQTRQLTFGPETTSYRFTMPRGILILQIYAVTPAGRASEPFTGTSIEGNVAPAVASWIAAHDAPSAVGDHSATVSFSWFSRDSWAVQGGKLPATVEVRPSTGGASQWSPLGIDKPATLTFGGLPNGVPVTFYAVTSNACGSSMEDRSPPYVPGVAVAFTAATPPLTLSPNRFYRYRFMASGDPAPTYRLVGAPRWLKIGRDGTVRGRAPRGTTSFTYSVEATNAVRPPFWPPSTDVSGPFTVKVLRGVTKKPPVPARAPARARS